MLYFIPKLKPSLHSQFHSLPTLNLSLSVSTFLYFLSSSQSTPPPDSMMSLASSTVDFVTSSEIMLFGVKSHSTHRVGEWKSCTRPWGQSPRCRSNTRRQGLCWHNGVQGVVTNTEGERQWRLERSALESKATLEALPAMKITSENKAMACAMCKDLLGVGDATKRFPCEHRYHGCWVLEILALFAG